MPIDPRRTSEDEDLARLLELKDELFCIFEPNGVVRSVRPSGALLGFSSEELIGKSLLARVHPEDAATTHERLRSAAPRGAHVRFESRCRGKDGEYRWLSWIVARAEDRTCAVVLSDATERKWVERELEASLSLVEATLESTADGILVADNAGKVVTFNSRFLELWGIPDVVVFSGAAAIDRACDPILAESQSQLSLVDELEQTASVDRYQVLTLRDGRVFERYSLPRRIRGEVEGRVWSFRDITERVRAERELREHLSMGIEHAVEGIARLDEEGRYVSVNAVFAKMLGFTESEMLGSEWASGCHPDDRPTALAAREDTSAGARSEIEGRVFKKDGSVAVLRALVVRADGPRGGHHVFVSDITEQRQLRERLHLADRMASMGTLTAGVAHELNNPLSFVIANVALLSEQLPALAASVGDKRVIELSELLGDMRTGTERLRKIVRDLKMFSRPEDVSSGAIDMRQVLESSLPMAWNEIRHRARLVKEYGSSVLVEGNEAQLGQVFLNLLINAAQAIPEGDVERNEIRVVTMIDPQDPTKVIVEIHDTGSGISSAALPHIFDPFFTTKPVGIGTGLGLSVCHGIVSKHGGEIQVVSKPGIGTTFRVVLPRGHDRPKANPPILQPPPPLPRSRLLVVDDEVMMGNALRRLLAKEYEVVVCASGRDALDVLGAQSAFDLVLCDVMMPDLTGMDVYEQLSREAPDVAERMVFMTGGTFTARAREFLDRVPNPRIDKPIDVRALRAWLRERLANA